MSNLDNIVDELHRLKITAGVTYAEIMRAANVSRRIAHDVHYGVATVASLRVIARYYGRTLSHDGPALLRARLSQGISRYEMRKLSGLALHTLKRIERGYVRVGFETFARYADAVGVELALVPTAAQVARDELTRWRDERVVPPGLLNLDEVISEILIERLEEAQQL